MRGSTGSAVFDHLQRNVAAQLTFDAAVVLNTGSMLAGFRMALHWVPPQVSSWPFCRLATIVSAVVAGGWVSSTKPLMPDFSRLNPLIRVLANLFTKKRLANTVKMVILTSLLSAIAATFLRRVTRNSNPWCSTVGPGHTHAGPVDIRGIGLMLLAVLGGALIDVPLQSLSASQQK